MAHKVILKAAGKELNVLGVNFGIVQNVDAHGKPSSQKSAGEINVTVRALGDTTFAEMAIDSFRRESGSIEYFKADSDSVQMTLEFKNAYVTKFKSNYNSTDDTPHTESFTFSAEEISIGGATFSKKDLWRQV